ncbi:unnamed protein product [Cuscuta epithymum]|uniref:Secreted protein n=1 Tax=Cuscuta epithymum TaxID=186058 RepID=A0AAV0CL88_9ASTE|nr:unnamed protein product [Cuscuta epithymum]
MSFCFFIFFFLFFFFASLLYSSSNANSFYRDPTLVNFLFFFVLSPATHLLRLPPSFLFHPSFSSFFLTGYQLIKYTQQQQNHITVARVSFTNSQSSLVIAQVN